MSRELTAALERLSADEAFGLMYGAYRYLAGLEGEGQSATAALLRRLRGGAVDAVLFCVKKLLEEQDEVRRVLAGQHAHEGQTARETLVNELQQLIYWACLLVAAQGAEYDALRLPEFLDAGQVGREPEKSAFEEGGVPAVAILRRALTGAGRALAEFNRGQPAEAIEPREVALADLRQMLSKPYLEPYLHGRLGGPRST